MNKYKQCSDCGKYLPQSEFWKHKADDRIWKNHSEREYLFHKCKECCQTILDYNNLDSILELLKTFDVPYIEYEWNIMFLKYGNKTIGRYLSLMRLMGFYGFGFDDSSRLNECHHQKIAQEKKNGEKNE